MNKRENTSIRLRGADFSYRYFHQCFIFGLMMIIILVMSFVSETFRTVYNYGNVMNGCLPIMLAAMGQFLVILTAGIDISVGSMVTLCNCVCVYIMTAMPDGLGAVIAIVAAIATGILCGAVNGLFIARFRLPAIIVTIATSTIFQGLALVIMPEPGGTVYKAFAKALTFRLGGAVPTSFFIAIIAIAVLAVVTNRTSFGKALRAVGGNESASFGTGVKIERTKFMAYVLCGLFCALSGLYLSARTNSADPNIGNTYTIYSISATVVGGTLMTGAVGESYGTACGAMIIFLVNNILNMLNVSSFYQYLYQGAVLIFALVVGSLEARRHGN